MFLVHNPHNTQNAQDRSPYPRLCYVLWIFLCLEDIMFFYYFIVLAQSNQYCLLEMSDVPEQ